MKGVNSFDENGYWSRYSNDNWSVCKIYDDVLRYEYTLSGERFDALEIVDELASLEAENAKLKALIERLAEAGEKACRDYEGFGYGIDNIFLTDKYIKPKSLPLEFSQDEFEDIVSEWQAMKGGE